jgi:hypothetical protein
LAIAFPQNNILVRRTAPGDGGHPRLSGTEEKTLAWVRGLNLRRPREYRVLPALGLIQEELIAVFKG